MRLIFLDVDGVLNNRESMRGKPTVYNVDPKCVARLNRICKRTGAMCVLSSTWRHSWTVAAFQQFLEQRGGFTGRVIDHTAHLPNEDRGVEIAAYLNQCSNRGYPAEAWAILDDDGDMGPLAGFLVQTKTADGLQEEHVDAAIELLLGQLGKELL